LTKQYQDRYSSSQARDACEPRAKRSLGQNFLRDPNIAGKIVRCLEIGAGDSVLEIGPGQGALTVFLEQSPATRLVLVEKDRHWAAVRQSAGRAQVVLADAMRLAWERFVSPWKFIGNLPYNVASPLMWDMFSRAPGLCRAVFMVQKEVGQRLTARPGSAAYGALSVWAQSFVLPRLEFIVPPQVFQPRPKVDSAVLSFVPLGGGQGQAFSRVALSSALKLCFQKRRKQLGGILKSAGHDPAVLESLGLDPAARPETLTPHEFQRLGDKIFR
jgi:16S rRNA (adenine1518-N6/adenine1519-N6)-dimethyltransferase